MNPINTTTPAAANNPIPSSTQQPEDKKNYIQPESSGSMDGKSLNVRDISARETLTADASAIARKTELSQQLAKAGIQQCFPASIADSIGLTHYQGTVWTRDNNMMISPWVLEQAGGLETTGHYLHLLSGYQTTTLTPGTNKSFTGDNHNLYGQLPIVQVNNSEAFFVERVMNRGYHREVREFFTKHPELCSEQLPKLFTLDNDEAIAYLHQEDHQEIKKQLTSMYGTIKKLMDAKAEDGSNLQYPRASFLLKKYIANGLDRLTPGTTDPELNVVSLCGKYLSALQAADPSKAKTEGSQLTPMIARALTYIYTNVMDEKGLPVGADYLDIFNDYLRDACLLTNAAILLYGLKNLQQITDCLDDEAFFKALNDAGENLPESLKKLSGSSTGVADMLSVLSDHLQATMQTELLFDANKGFAPRWFVRSEHKVENPQDPPEFIKQFIEKRLQMPDHASFSDGSVADPFGLSWAVLADAVPRENYPDVAEKFHQFYQEDGFLFIPMRNCGEQKPLMINSGGYTFWPDKILRCGIALVEMYNRTGESGYLELAQKIRQKVSGLEGFNEYYLKDGDAFVPSGSKNQGWHIFAYCHLTAMLKAAEAE